METPKNRVYDDALEARATEFHGHGGPFMVVGLRMGLVALERLDCRGWFDLRCAVGLRWSPPDSCVIDGIQCSAGCTMGKHNIEVEEREGVEAVFTSKGGCVTVKLRPEVLQRLRGGLGSCASREVMDELASAPAEELFEIKA
ncbi:formylmethanofuran dehydrogenase subunit E family protein [Candidatus Bathyarchaeota archaeon]|nr:formylmethanofuran dehydrogenase subunit E family protein [Candidatus Bathyarchaeota archaeon]